MEVPPAAEPARCLADLPMIELEAISLTNLLTLSPATPDQLDLLAKSRRGPSNVRP